MFGTPKVGFFSVFEAFHFTAPKAGRPRRPEIDAILGAPPVTSCLIIINEQIVILMAYGLLKLVLIRWLVVIPHDGLLLLTNP